MVAALVCLLLSASPDLEEGRAASAALKYARAVEPLSRAAGNAATPRSERLEALDLLARAQLALGRPLEAQSAFAQLLAIDPMAEEPRAAPKVRAAFQGAKKAAFAPDFARLEQRQLGSEGVTIALVNPWRRELVVLVHRAGAADQPLALTEGEAVVPLPPGSRLWLEARTPQGATVCALGSRTEPLAGPPEPARAADAPTVTQLSPPPGPPPLFPPVEPKAPTTSGRRIGGWVTLGTGLVLALVGAGLLIWGAADLARAADFPLGDTTYEESQALSVSGPFKQLVGGITLGVGGASLLTGALLLLIPEAT
jgi:hypothetical protein